MRLADFDPQVVAEYDITDKVLDRVVRYLQLLQGPDALALEDIALGGYYGTAALLHEVVELKVLLGREPRLLEMGRDAILAFWHANEDAHARALVSEYEYLRDAIKRLFDVTVDIGALVVANASDWDLDLLIESNVEIPLFKPDDKQIWWALEFLDRLRGVGRPWIVHTVLNRLWGLSNGEEAK